MTEAECVAELMKLYQRMVKEIKGQYKMKNCFITDKCSFDRSDCLWK